MATRTLTPQIAALAADISSVMRTDAPAIEVGGAKGVYFDIEGDRRMLMVMVKRGIATWYFKVMGSPQVVGKNKQAFEAFLKSVKFNGGVDE